MALLICEGACNPALPNFDAAAEVYARHLAGPDGLVPEVLTDFLLAQRRQLRHTEHRSLYRNRYACVLCGCERAYGAESTVSLWAERAS